MEAPPLRTLLILVCFLGFFGLMVAFVPPELASPDTYRNYTVEDTWTVRDVLYYGEYFTHEMNETGGFDLGTGYYKVDVDLGERNFDFYYKKSTEENKMCFIRHFYGLWFLWAHDMKVYDYEHGIYGELRKCEVEEIQEDYNTTQPYLFECNHFDVSVDFAYNTTLYNNVTHAWENQELTVRIGMEFDDFNTGMNAFDMVGMVMFFQNPDIHPVLNAFIVIPLWVALVYIAFAFLLAVIKALPFT